MGVREEFPSIMKEDFQTIRGDFTCADGSIKPDWSIISRRQYLTESSFLVVLSGPKDLIEECGRALQEPHWPYYLGRKSCIPTRPIFDRITEEYSSLLDALSRIPWEHRTLSADPEISPGPKPEKLRCVIEKKANINYHMDKKRQDCVRINPGRLYDFRFVDVVYVPTASLPA